MTSIINKTFKKNMFSSFTHWNNFCHQIFLGVKFYNWDINPWKEVFFYNGNADTTLAALLQMASLYYSSLDRVHAVRTEVALSASE